MKAPRTPRLPGDAGETAVSASRRVYGVLRERILEMEMAPGMRIDEHALAAEHQVSRTPVHEAVQRLAEEGLVEVIQRVGTFVARIPIDELEEAMLVRTALEVEVVRKAGNRITPEGIEQLRSILDEQEHCAAAQDLQGFHRSDEAFHAALADIAGHPGVWRAILQAKTQVDRFRRLTLPISGRMDGVIEEHRAVVEAFANGRVGEATQAMREHLDHVLPVIKITRGFRPDFFMSGAMKRTEGV